METSEEVIKAKKSGSYSGAWCEDESMSISWNKRSSDWK